MRFRAPKGTPTFRMLLENIGCTDFGVIARHFGIGESTVRRYWQVDKAPRALMLALYWETSWGISSQDVNLYNTAQVHREHARSLNELVEHLKRHITMLEEATITGSANAPCFDPYRPSPVKVKDPARTELRDRMAL